MATKKQTQAEPEFPFTFDHETQKKRCNKCGSVMSGGAAHGACPSEAQVAAAKGGYVWPDRTEGMEGRKQ